MSGARPDADASPGRAAVVVRTGSGMTDKSNGEATRGRTVPGRCFAGPRPRRYNRPMLFVIIGRDGPDGKTLRPGLRPAHLDHVRRYEAQGHVVMAGPFTDGAGSMLLVQFDTIEEVHAMAAADPYRTGGVFASVEVHPFLRVFPETPAVAS